MARQGEETSAGLVLPACFLLCCHDRPQALQVPEPHQGYLRIDTFGMHSYPYKGVCLILVCLTCYSSRRLLVVIHVCASRSRMCQRRASTTGSTPPMCCHLHACATSCATTTDWLVTMRTCILFAENTVPTSAVPIYSILLPIVAFLLWRIIPQMRGRRNVTWFDL
jgi:hypothetical protein